MLRGRFRVGKGYIESAGWLDDAVSATVIALREKQLRLLPAAKPLTQRFGAKFFQSLPRTAGVYLMFDERGRCIYVGQSKNLRQRVNSYRHVHPERSSRKMVRLVHSVARIEWEQCENANAAQLRENALLRQHRPRFNTLNTYPKIHCFIGFRLSPDSWRFQFSRDKLADGYQRYGAFKSGCLVGYAALLRLLWLAVHQSVDLQQYPRQLLAEKPSKEFTIHLNDSGTFARERAAELLCEFFSGRSSQLSEWLATQMPDSELMSPFQRNLLVSDFEQLKNFFRNGPQRNAELQAKHKLDATVIAQEALDDLLIGWRRSSKPQLV